MIVLDGDARVCVWNPSAAAMVGISAREAIGRSIDSVLPGMPAPGGDMSGHHRLLLPLEGFELRIDASVSPIRVDGLPWSALVIARPVQHGAAAAMYDELTGLPGRALFTERVEHAVNRLARRRSPALVLLLDIDRFPEINATLGHAGGDEVLHAVAERLRSALRATDTLARFGED